MFGYIYYPAPRFALEEIQVAGVPFLQVALPERRGWRMRWLVRRAAKVLRRQGVHQAVFPENFSGLELFTSRGILPASDLALRRAVAVETLVSRLTEAGLDPRSSTVAVLAPAPTSTVGELLRGLSRKVRYLKLFAGGGGEELPTSCAGRPAWPCRWWSSGTCAGASTGRSCSRSRRRTFCARMCPLPSGRGPRATCPPTSPCPIRRAIPPRTSS